MRRLTVNDEGKVVFFLDFGAFFDEEAPDFFAFGACLMSDEGFAEKLFGVGFDFADIVGEFNAAGFAASAGMDLRFDHNDVRADFLGVLHGFFDAEGRQSLGNIDPVRL